LKDIYGKRRSFELFETKSYFIFREKKELELSQVRQNIEDSKRLGSEKNIRNKSDLDRRVRELKSNNTKKFVEERKRQTMKHDREKDHLLKSHEAQKATLLTEIDKVCIYDNIFFTFQFRLRISAGLNGQTRIGGVPLEKKCLEGGTGIKKTIRRVKDLLRWWAPRHESY
jgi:hypothetical protein